MKRKVFLASLFSLSAFVTILIYSGFRFFSAKPTTKQAQIEVVQNVSTTPEITPTPTIIKPKLAKLTTIECVGPDGKHFQATKTDCDNLNSYWNKNQPSNPSTPSNNSNTSTSPISLASNPTITPVVTPTPTTTPSYPISVSSSNVDVTIHKGTNPNPMSYIYGSGFTMTYQRGVCGYTLVRTSNLTATHGFIDGSGGFNSNYAGTKEFTSYTTPQLELGTYKSTYNLRYCQNGNYFDGPTINLTINFVE